MVSTHSKYLSLKTDDRLEGFVIVVGKKVASLAVHRNKIRRRLREILQEVASKQSGTVYTKKGIDELTFKELKKEVSELIMSA